MTGPKLGLKAKSRILYLVLLSCLTYFLVASQVQGQTYTLANSVFGNGGVPPIVGSGYLIQCTLGQPCIGVVSNASYQLRSGIGHDVYGVIISHVVEGFEQLSNLPTGFRLDQNYPNPFNPTTAIRFALARPSEVNLTLINILGQTVATLVSQELSVGEYEVSVNGDGLASGVYFYRIVAGDFVDQKRLVLLK